MSAKENPNNSGPAEALRALREEVERLARRMDALEGQHAATPDKAREPAGLQREVRALRARLNSLERESKRNRDILKREVRAIWDHPAFRRLIRFNVVGLKLLGFFGIMGPRDRWNTATTTQPKKHSVPREGLAGKSPVDDTALREEPETYLRGFSALANARKGPELAESEGRLIVDASRLFSPHLTGVGYYCAHLTRALLRRHGGSITAYSGKPLPSWILDYAGRPDFVHMPPEQCINDFKQLGKAPALEAIAGPYDTYLHTSASYAPLLKAQKSISVIYDLAPIACPETVPESVSKSCETYNKHLAATSERFIAISEYTKQHFVAFTAVDPSRVDVISVGMDPIFRHPVQERDRDRVIAKYGLAQPYIMCVGTLQPRKNLLRLLQAYNQLKERGAKIPRLLLVGSDQWAAMEAFTAELDRLQHDKSVAFTGYVDRFDLPALYERCEAFVYPSYFEGYGMPVAEAMACGAPIICADRTSLPEVAGDAAVYCDPFSVESIANALESTLSAPDKLAGLREKSFEQSETFPSWDDVADQFLAIHEKVRASRAQ